MTIRDRGLYLRNAPDWGALEGCFGGRVSPTDVDGMVEINGCVLFLEAKASDATVKRGQEIAFAALASRPRTAVVVIYHTSASPLVPVALQVWTAKGPRPRESCTLEALRQRVTAWAKAARANKPEAA